MPARAYALPILDQATTSDPPPTAAPADRAADRRLLVVLLGVGGVFGLLFALLTPPFASPDEATHLFRSYQLSEGRVFAERTEEGERLGGRLPSSVSEDVGALDGGVGRSWREIRSALGNPSGGPRVFVDFQNTALYPPLTYAPQVVGVGIGRLFGVSTVGLMYLARLANLAAFLALMAVAARRFPRSGWFPVVVAILPVTLFFAGSVSADVLSLALCALAVTEAIHKDRPWSFLVVAVALGLSKPPYFLVTLFGLAVWFVQGRRRWQLPVGVAAAFVLAAAWSRWAAHVFVPYRPLIAPDLDVRPEDQLSHVLAHPFDLAAAFLATAVEDADMWLRQLLGPWGRNIEAPMALVVASLLLVAFVAVAAPWREHLEVSRTLRTVAGALAVLTVLATIGAVYLYSNEVGADRIRLVYGRYGLPVLPLVLLALPRPARVPGFADHPRAFDLTAAGLASLLLIVSLLTVL